MIPRADKEAFRQSRHHVVDAGQAWRRMTKGSLMQCLPILDGWRALSILLVIAGHLLPADDRARRAGRAPLA